MTLADDLTPEEQTLVRFEVAKRNLVEQMVLYGINGEQARIQVESLVVLALSAGKVIEKVNK